MTRDEAESAFVCEVRELDAEWSEAAQEAAERRWQAINATLPDPINLEALYMLRHVRAVD